MRILINASSARLGGGMTVLRKLLPALRAESAGRHQLTLIAREQAWRGPARFAFEQLALPLKNADAILALGGVASLAARVPQVVVVQNVAPFDADVCARAEPLQRARFAALRELGRASALVAKKVVLLSTWALHHVGPQLGLKKGQGSRVPLGRDEAFSPEAKDRAGPILTALGLPARYLLCVSDLYHYKNLPQLVLGFARSGIPDAVPLLLVGALAEERVAREVRRVAERERISHRVKLLGALPYEDLPPLYAAASAIAFPSSCENFPLILIEAIASGAPLCTSRAGPMPELAGASALYFDPFDPDDIAGQLHAAFSGRAPDTGPQQAAKFSWAIAARRLLALLEEIA